LRTAAIALIVLFIAGVGYRYLGDTAFPVRPDIGTTEFGPLIDLSANTALPVLVLHPPKTRLEAFWSAALAKALGGKEEVRISHGRIDVLTSTYAIEVDWLHKWHEGLGQAQHYGLNTGKWPAVALIIKPDEWPLNAHRRSKVAEIRLVAEKLGGEAVLLRYAPPPPPLPSER